MGNGVHASQCRSLAATLDRRSPPREITCKQWLLRFAYTPPCNKARGSASCASPGSCSLGGVALACIPRRSPCPKPSVLPDVALWLLPEPRRNQGCALPTAGRTVCARRERTAPIPARPQPRNLRLPEVRPPPRGGSELPAATARACAKWE